MAQKKKRAPAKKAPAKKVAKPTLRFATPFTAAPPIANSIMPLSQVIGQQAANAIAATGQIQFHAAGDTGKGPDTAQTLVADAMTTDYNLQNPDKSPAFFFHLGDVTYGHDKVQLFRRQFYEPYVHYPGKIIGIPGNHDGETFPSSDPVSLKAFMANFCASSQAVPPIAGSIFRQTMDQPGVYWLLDAPFVQIVGLYSNAAENPGFIRGQIPTEVQYNWLVTTLRAIKTARDQGSNKKKLIMATHHPPYTSGGHSPSTEMLADLDSACTQAGIMPDLFLSGHAHSYQRYTRRLPFAGKQLAIPYIVAGTGGINDQAIVAASGQVTGQATFEKSMKGYGYLLITVNASKISGTFYAVDPSTGQKTQYDQFTA